MSFNQNAKRDAAILVWRDAQKALQQAKEDEAAARKMLLSEVFAYDENALDEGTKNIELGQGYKLKATFKVNRTLNAELLDDALDEIEKRGPEGKFIAERLVKFKPELSVSEYRKLDQEYATIINKVIVAKSATPSVELIAPKSK